jgi:purine-nucleoside phosphorylase
MMLRIREYGELQGIARDRLPQIALVLGSGLGDLVELVGDAVELPFASIAGMYTPSVPGHRGALILGTWGRVSVLVFAGRLHHYEGHPWRTVLQPIRIARELGASILVTTNAAGGIRNDLCPGDLMAIRAHLDWTRPNWWRERTEAQAAPIADASSGKSMLHWKSPYSKRLLDLLPVPAGIYAQTTGACYETPAEVRALRACGADAVGMSTAREIQTGHDLGMECAAISCITNKAAGLEPGPIQHDDVLATGRSVKTKLVSLLKTFLLRASEESPS